MILTNQRQEILSFLEGNKSHPSTEEVYEAVKVKLPRISKATVYQNLHYLVSEGLITQLDIKGVFRFEPDVSPHNHMICNSCGAIFDFYSPEIKDVSRGYAKKLGFKVEKAEIQISGLCKNCKR